MLAKLEWNVGSINNKCKPKKHHNSISDAVFVSFVIIKKMQKTIGKNSMRINENGNMQQSAMTMTKCCVPDRWKDKKVQETATNSTAAPKSFCFVFGFVLWLKKQH